MEKQHEVAQGAQAGDDIAHMQLVMRGADDDLDCAKRLHAAGYRRAALATQPAVPITRRPIDATRVLELWEDSQRCCNDGYALRFARAIEAEAHSAVRGAEHE